MTSAIPATGEPKLSLDQAKAVVETTIHPRVTEQFIKDRIKHVDYLWLGQLSICVITHVNGFMVNGQSAPASKDNFNAEVGKRYAYDNAFKQLWPLEGFLLRETLYRNAPHGL